jgi:hypothetical protein
MDIKLNEFFKTKDVKYLIYGDTDSLYFTFSNIVEKHYKDKTPLEITRALDKLMENHLRKFINEATNNIAEFQNYYKKTIVFKREAIGSGFWCVHPTTNISTPDGDINIVDLFDSCNVGSDVCSVDNIKCMSIQPNGEQVVDDIIRVMRKYYIGDMYTITDSFGKQIKVTEDHQVLVLRGNTKTWVKAKNLKETDALIYVK